MRRDLELGGASAGEYLTRSCLRVRVDAHRAGQSCGHCKEGMGRLANDLDTMIDHGEGGRGVVREWSEAVVGEA